MTSAHTSGENNLSNCEAGAPLEGNYFVSAYPPFSCWKRKSATDVLHILERVDSSPEDGPLGLYVHIPFCTVRCLYCYYLSYAQKSNEVIERYLQALIKELSLYYELTDLSARSVKFAYFGGGTPSILSASQIRTLFGGLKKSLPWTATEEITFECSPKGIDKEKLSALRDAGVTRISMGVQQLDDEVLRKNGRVHLVSDVEQAYEMFQQMGFDVVNLDLIVGLVGESDSSFMASVEKIVEMNPTSVTIYQLEIPSNTPLYHLYHDQKLNEAPVSWNVKRARLAEGFKALEQAGYQLRSAYTAVRGPEFRPFVYQDAQYRGADLIGIGASSFSYYAGAHYQNLAKLETYLQRVESGQLPIERVYVLSEEEQLIREFILQLKLGEVDRSYFLDKFEVDIFARFSEAITHFESQALLEGNGKQLKLTREGLLQVDHMLPIFYLPEHQDIRDSKELAVLKPF